MKKVKIYTDGACSGNPGPGGWGAVLIYGEKEKRISGFSENTTNNRMELTAVIKSIELLKEECEVSVYTDSSYIYNAFSNNWIDNWTSNNWKTKQKKDVLNSDLWRELLNASKRHEMKWFKVKGHSNDKYNNIADKLATSSIAKNRS